jgi:hypothetical protein
MTVSGMKWFSKMSIKVFERPTRCFTDAHRLFTEYRSDKGKPKVADASEDALAKILPRPLSGSREAVRF